MKKKYIIFIAIFIVAIATFSVFAEGIRLEKIRYRPYNPVLMSKELQIKVRKETKGMDEDQIIKYSLRKTRELLTFSTKCEKFDDSRKTKMHCVGYARVLATICNYAFSVNELKGKAKPVVGHVYLYGTNLNDYSSLLPEKWKNFTKDHDFVEVKLSNGKIIFADSSLDIIQ